MIKKSPRKKKAELIKEDDFIKSLKNPFLIFLFGVFRYSMKEVLLLLILIILGLWVLTSFSYTGDKIKIKPNVKINVNKATE